jgi:hypothetical protein
VLHDADLAEAILDRVLERGRLIHMRGPSFRTRHLKPAKPEEKHSLVDPDAIPDSIKSASAEDRAPLPSDPSAAGAPLRGQGKPRGVESGKRRGFGGRAPKTWLTISGKGSSEFPEPTRRGWWNGLVMKGFHFFQPQTCRIRVKAGNG